MVHRRRNPYLASLVLLVMTLVAWRVTRKAEPSYQGKPLSYWVVLYCRNSSSLDSPEARQAAEAISQIGTNAVPYLLEWMQYDPLQSRFEYRWAELAAKYRLLRPTDPLLRRLTRADSNMYKAETRAIGSSHAFILLHSQAQAVMPALLRFMGAPGFQDHENRFFNALHYVTDKENQSLLIAYLADTNSLGRAEGFRCLKVSCLSTNADRAMTCVMQGMADPDPDVQYWAGNALANGFWHEPAGILDIASDKFRATTAPFLRARILLALWREKWQAEEARSFITLALQDPDPGVRLAAANVLPTLTNTPVR